MSWLLSAANSVLASSINSQSATDGWVLTSDGAGGSAWEAIPAIAESNDLTAAVVWADIPIANVPTGVSGVTVALGNHSHAGVYEPVDATIVRTGDAAWNASDWDTAYGWGDHGSGGYLTSVAITDLDNGTDGELITWSATGVATTVAVGSAGEVLTSNGVGAAPTFQAAAGGGGVSTKPGQYRGVSTQGMSTSIVTIDLQTETYDPDSNYSVSSDIVTVVEAGYYFISYSVMMSVDSGSGNQRCNVRSWITKNGTATILAGSYGASFVDEGSSPDFSSGTGFIALLAASDTIRIRANLSQNTDVSTVPSQTHLSIFKLRDT